MTFKNGFILKDINYGSMKQYLDEHIVCLVMVKSKSTYLKMNPYY